MRAAPRRGEVKTLAKLLKSDMQRRELFAELDSSLARKEGFVADFFKHLAAIDGVELIFLHDDQIPIGYLPDHFIVRQAKLPYERRYLS